MLHTATPLLCREIATQQVPLRGALSDPRIPDECPQEVLDAIHACMKVLT